MAIPTLTPYSLPSEWTANKVQWSVEPDRAVLLIHDMQQYFCDFWGEDSAFIAALVARLAQVRERCKALGIPVVYTAQPAEQADADRALLTDMWGPGITQHPERQAIVAGLAPAADDTVLTKWRYSAFQRSPLEHMMAELGRDQLRRRAGCSRSYRRGTRILAGSFFADARACEFQRAQRAHLRHLHSSRRDIPGAVVASLECGCRRPRHRLAGSATGRRLGPAEAG